jgi:CDP-glucose 4,6-dehydratase
MSEGRSVPSFWQGKRVLITGHTGFKGGWLAVWLRRLGADVAGYALPPEGEPNLFTAARVGEGIAHVEADLRDVERLGRAFAEHRPEVVFHLAAQSLVRRGYRDPVGTFDVNVLGTVRLLEAVRERPEVRSVVVVTSDKCYDNREWEWPYRESDALGGRDPYAASKACAELVTAAYRASFLPGGGERRVAVASARSGNVIGGGDWAEDRLVPDLLAALSTGRPARIRSPEAVRPWQHVLEPLSGYLLLAERLWQDGAEFAGAWNFGPDERDARPVAWLADRLCAAWGGGAGWERDPEPGPREAHLLRLDAARARACLGWEARLRLAEALEWVVEWHRAHAAGGDVRAVTEEQLDRYEALAAVGG